MRKLSVFKVCPICNNKFNPVYLPTGGLSTYCSLQCFGKTKIGKPSWNKGMKLPQFSGKNHWNWKDSIIFKECLKCNKKFRTYTYITKKGGGKFCSKSCANGYKTMEDGSHTWKGNNVGYAGLHQWVYKHKGKASFCEFNKSHKTTRFQWANIDHKYHRKLDDWISLCPSCHSKYDKKLRQNIS